MAIKVLFFDNSAVLKLFLEEQGSDIIDWLTSNKVKLRLHFVINEQVCSEFLNKIIQLERVGRLSKDQADKIIKKFTKFYKGKVFRVIGQRIISNTKIEQSLSQIIEELSLTEGKNDWDALHYQSIVNALAYLGGESTPILVTADTSFGNKVSSKGYRVINPLKQSIEEIKNILA
jgi:predicted nucleic acid-binding protein